MKRIFNGHIYLGRMTSRVNDEFIERLDERLEVSPAGIRWFCGMHDLEQTFICQAL